MRETVLTSNPQPIPLSVKMPELELKVQISLEKSRSSAHLFGSEVQELGVRLVVRQVNKQLSELTALGFFVLAARRLDLGLCSRSHDLVLGNLVKTSRLRLGT